MDDLEFQKISDFITKLSSLDSNEQYNRAMLEAKEALEKLKTSLKFIVWKYPELKINLKCKINVKKQGGSK